MIDRSFLIRALGLYVPLVVAAALGRWRLRSPQHLAAVLAGMSWTLPALLLLQIFNGVFHWWTFHAPGGLIRGIPADLYLGWAILWSALPILIFPRVSPWITAAVFVGLDLVLMPLCSPVVNLSPRWMVGEAVGLVLVLMPSLQFARWSWDRTRVRARASLWVISFSALVFFLIPEIVFATAGRGDWGPILSGNPWLRNLRLQAMAIVSVAALSAVQEFALRGHGTPIPFDPPTSLVTSGLYRYLSNPMQTSGALAMTAWGIMLKNPWLAGAGPVTLVYCMGLAYWHEGLNMRERFGDAWLRYRRNVPAWLPRWRPWQDRELAVPRLYIASGCGPCSEVRSWFESHSPIGLRIFPAEEHPSRDLTRITYAPMDGTGEEEGVKAIARGLEHINLSWAFAGAFLRLPGVSWLAQLLIDTAGFGPRRIERKNCVVKQTSSARSPI